MLGLCWVYVCICIRLRIGAVSPKLPAAKRCPGCGRTIARELFEYHASGCAALGLPVMKHNSVRDLCEQFAVEAGQTVVHEPREYQAYRCRSCAELLSASGIRNHGCRAKADRTGVDFRVLWPEGAAVYDVTVVQTRAPSYRATPAQQVVTNIDEHKHTIYDDQCRSNSEQLSVLTLRAAGGLCENTRAFIARCAHDRCNDFPHLSFKEEVRRMSVELAIKLQRFNGECGATGLARHRSD